MSELLKIEYLSKNLNSEQAFWARKIYYFLFSLNFEYPNFKEWYWSMFNISGSLKKNREILICKKLDNILGVAILKKDIHESKICTLRVSNAYQNIGIGCFLMERSFEYLNNDKPLITIHISKYHIFKRIFKKYNFSLEQELNLYYGIFKSELVYNDILSDVQNFDLSIEKKALIGIERMFFNYSDGRKIYIPQANEIINKNCGIII